MSRKHAFAALALLALASPVGAQAPQPATMSFFVTSEGLGQGGDQGGDLGGLAGADVRCQSLAQAVGAGGRSWRAYLSTQGVSAIHARDRIGAGPWRNAQGVVIAQSVADLHGETNNLNKQTALDEAGRVVNGRGDTPNRHDILTGSRPDGTAFPATSDMSCRNWTHGGAEGAAMMGHHDRLGLRDDAPSRSWNASHASRGGCGMEALRSTGGAGLFYCFATN